MVQRHFTGNNAFCGKAWYKLTLLALVLFFFCTGSIKAQEQKTKNTVYKIHPLIELPATIGLFGANMIGYDLMKDKKRLDSASIVQLDKNKIWAFDRWAVNQNVNFREEAHNISDWGMNISLVLPALLAFDRNIRQDWLRLIVLYMETQAINSAVYAWGVSQWSTRKRPFVYNMKIPINEKLGSGTTDSFFSGHTSTTATSSFFMAKVYCDYHPELGRKKWLVYGAALIPPVFVGYYRIKALKHFPSDVLTGLAVGAAIGIVVPELHRTKKNKALSIVPFTGGFSGLNINYKITYN
jgi:membrane-associated phospholipid phosphatase